MKEQATFLLVALVCAYSLVVVYGQSSPLMLKPCFVTGRNNIVAQENRDVNVLTQYGFTYSFWIKPTSGPVNEWRNIFQRGGAYEQRTPAVFIIPNTLRVHARMGAQNDWNDGCDTDASLVQNQWSHLAFTFSTGSFKVYINGQVACEKANSQFSGAANSKLYFSDPFITSFPAQIGDLRVWGTALPQAQIQNVINENKHLQYCKYADLALQRAPRIYMQQDETFFPAPVWYSLQNSKLVCNNKQKNGPLFPNTLENGDNCFITTMQDLGGPDNYNPAHLKGLNPMQYTVPAYAFVKEISSNIVDVIYFTFYPYNRGKRVCIGYFSRGCPVPEVWGTCPVPFQNLGCIGGYKTFGNHIGDWEHVTARFVNGVLSQYYLSAHNFGGAKSPSSLAHAGTHPVVYEAQGSHGLYPDTGRHVYQDIVIDQLSDDTGAGIAWDTWNGLEIVQTQFGSGPFNYPGDNGVFNYVGRWGNSKSGCGVFSAFEKIAGECTLNDGPGAVSIRDFVQMRSTTTIEN